MDQYRSQELLQRAKAGDVDALGELLEMYQSCLLFLARLQVDRRLQGKASSSDLVQETYLRAHRYFEQFNGQSEQEFAAWLRSILVTVIANHVRSYFGTQQRDPRLEQSLATELDNASSIMERSLMAAEVTPSENAVNRESAHLLAEAIERLPDDYRRAIVLRDFEGLPFNEIATIMGRSVDSVQKLWIRALTQLKRSLQ